MNDGPVVRLDEVHAGYRRRLRRVPVLSGASWSAVPGSITALVGPNGAGKTTTFRLLLGILAPEAGTVTVDGLPPRTYRRRHGVAFLPEERVPLPGWTVSALVEAGCLRSPRGGASSARRARVHLERLGMDGMARRSVDALSRGQARLAMLAFALAGDPALVILDEPWSGLDAEARCVLGRILEELRGRGGTVLVSSHERLEVARVADRTVVMASGVPPRQVRRAGGTGAALEGLVRDPGR